MKLAVAFCSGFLIMTVPMAVGIYFLIISNSSGGKYTGTLIASDKYYDQSDDSNSGTWYVSEIFRKDQTNDTCYVLRPTEYYTAHAVNDAKDRVILGTTRTIWTYWYNSNKCYDENIKFQNTITGICLLGFSILVAVLCCCTQCYIDLFGHQLHLSRYFRSATEEEKEEESGRENRIQVGLEPSHDMQGHLSDGKTIELGEVQVMEKEEP